MAIQLLKTTFPDLRWATLWMIVVSAFWVNTLAFAANEAILPLGDSITQADLNFNSYRRPLWHRLNAAGYSVDFVGSRNYNGFRSFGPPPNPDFDLDHEGHPGARADGLLGDLPRWLTGYTPDIVLLHAGTNDLLNPETPESTIGDLKGIVDALRNDNPDVIVLMAQIIPTINSNKNDKFTQFNAQMQSIVDEKSTAQSPIILVDQNTGFDPLTDTYDGVHPNLRGEEKMAQRWYDALVGILPPPGEISPPPIDDIAPTVVDVNAGINDTQVLVEFSEPVEQTSAEDILKYQIDQGVEVTSARLGGDLKYVALTVSPLTPAITYQININGVLDLADNPTIDAATFTFTETHRVTDGLLVLYDFLNGSGDIVYDISGLGAPMDLTIANPNNVSWIPGGGLSVNASTIISAPVDSKIFAACTASNAITVEAWVEAAKTTQSGPARMVTLSNGSRSRNFTLGPHGSNYHGRLRTTTAGKNGTSPALITGSGVVGTTLAHIVYTRDSAGNAKIYKDSVEVASKFVDGDLSNWDETYRFALANELNAERPWLGNYYLVATYGRALSSQEIQSNFEAGLVGSSGNRPPVADAGLPQTVTDFDGDGHEFVILDGSGSTDDQGIVAYQWGEGGIEIATGASPQVDLAVGVHTLTLTVTDADNASNTNTVAIMVEAVEAANEAPIAQAGEDQTVMDADGDGLEFITLNGSGSTDDQGVVAYQWREGGIEIATGASPRVDLAVGVHTLTLTVTDADNASNMDAVVISVEAAAIDDVAPSLDNVTANSDTSIAVLFSEPVEQTSAENILNYQIDQGVEVTAARLGGDLTSVALTVSPLTPSITYQINVNDVLDLADNPTIDTAPFTFTETHRVTDGLLVLYDFLNSSGDIVYDVSGLGAPMDLTIDNPNNVSWIPGGGLSVNASTIISAPVDSKIFAACTASNAITVEAWVESANTTQSGPARMVTLSNGSHSRNFTLGPQGSNYHARLRTTTTGDNGTRPAMKTGSGVVGTTLAHIVYTRDSVGNAKIYKDSVEIDSQLIDGDLSNWDGTHRFALANELNAERPWLGNYYLVATYGRALSSQEVQSNFEAGLAGSSGNRPPVAVARVPQIVTDVDGDGGQAVTLNGAGSTDDRGITSYEWRENGGTIATSASPRINLAVGVHTLTLTVTDADGASDTDTVEITVEAANEAPTAQAGVDQTVVDGDGSESIALDGSTSTDDRGIVSYQWLENGNAIATGVSPLIDLAVGVHTLTLTVIDTDGASDSDTVVITVEAANEVPIAQAGVDQTIVDVDGDGSESIALDGSTSTDDRGITLYQWLENGSVIATGVSPRIDLAMGVHTLTLSVTDTDGITASDSVLITIEAAPVQNPVIEVASIILKGTVDGQGSIVSNVTVSINGGLPENVDTLIPDGNNASWEKEIVLPAGNATITITSENEAAKSSSTVMSLTR